MTIEKNNITRSRITYFLGAGASALTGIPTTADLIRDYIRHFNDNRNIAIILRKYEPTKNRKPTIEDLYVHINQLKIEDNNLLQDLPSMYAQNNSEECKSTKDIIKELKESLNKYMFDVLKPKEDLDTYVSLIEQMFDLAKIKDEKIVTIATTNYDILIEESCGDLGLNIIDGFKRKTDGNGEWHDDFNNFKSGIKLLKLHGSLNWHRDKDNNKMILSESSIRDYDEHSTWIEPIPQGKGSEDVPFKPIREEFCKVLNETKLLVVVGFSFNNDDVWNKKIKSALDDGMRLLFISPKTNKFITDNNGCELETKDDIVKYKLNNSDTKNVQNNSMVDYYPTYLANHNIDLVIKVMQYVKDKYIN